MYDNGNVNGYPVITTSHMLKNASSEYGIIFGNWADLIIGSWSGLDLVIDPYTVATYGKVRIVINAYFDVKKRRNESFAAGTMK